MSKKWKIFGYQTNVEWYDVKVKFKQLLRKITYSWVCQEAICLSFAAYMWLVYLTSKKEFVNSELLIEAAKNKKPIIVTFWHNRLMMAPFITRPVKKLYPDYKMMTLASEHGDGRFVGRVMEKFGLISILGSTNDGRKSSRGISISALRTLVKGLKKGYALGITPDGPRGPNQKINGEITHIAKLSGANIVACSYSSSKMKEFNSWDKFKVPLPFGKLCFYFDEKVLCLDTGDENTKKDLEKRMNFVQNESARHVSNDF